MTTLKKRVGPWAVVTGASEGIGRAFAEQLAKEGIHVVLVARREALLEDLAFNLGERYGVDTKIIVADLAQREGNLAVIQMTAELEIGLFVAAAGFGTSGSYLDGKLENELQMIDVNCRSVAQLTYHFAERFKAQRRGGLILMSSIVAFQGVPKSANYAATKAYIQSLAEGLYFDLKPYNIDVIASAPGPVASGFAKRADMIMGQATTPLIVAKGTLAALGKMRTVRPGILSKFLGYSLAILPRVGRINVMAAIMSGMTKHHE